MFIVAHDLLGSITTNGSSGMGAGIGRGSSAVGGEEFCVKTAGVKMSALLLVLESIKLIFVDALWSLLYVLS